MADERYEERDQFPELINGGQVDEAIVNTPPTEKGVFNTGITSTQIEQVVDLPVPTTDDEGKVLKVDAEGKWELAADAEGTVVVANPTLAGTEADLTGLQVGATKYKVPEGMQVLELTNSSGTLTDAQYALASGNNCVLKFANRLYYKTYQDVYGISYGYPQIFVAGDTNVQKERIEIDSSTKGFVLYIDDEIIANPTLAGTESSLTSLQIGTTKYKVGAESPVAYEGTSSLPSGASFSDWTLHRGIKEGNILWITLVGKIINDSGSAIGPVEVYSITLPSGVSSKIYRQDGTTCNNAYSSSQQVLFGNGIQGSQTARFSITSASANTLSVWVLTSINTGSSAFVDLRVPIFLDIGTVES